MSIKKFGIVIFNHIFILESESHRDFPMRFVSMCNYIIDLETSEIIKERWPTEEFDAKTLVPLFKFYDVSHLSQIQEAVNISLFP